MPPFPPKYQTGYKRIRLMNIKILFSLIKINPRLHVESLNKLDYSNILPILVLEWYTGESD